MTNPDGKKGRMTKSEMAAWYWAVCTAREETPVGSEEDALESRDAFFGEWARLLFVEAGRPHGFPWRMDD